MMQSDLKSRLGRDNRQVKSSLTVSRLLSIRRICISGGPVAMVTRILPKQSVNIGIVGTDECYLNFRWTDNYDELIRDC